MLKAANKIDIATEAATASPSWAEQRHHPALIAAMALLMVAIVAATAYRIHRNYSPPQCAFDWQNRGFSDFHNGTYFPTQAFVAGHSPYCSEIAQQHNMCRATPPYSPVVFILHTPFAMMPLEISRVVFFIFNFGLLAALAFCSIKMSKQQFRWFDFFAITNLLLISRPGHISLFTGYFTAELVLGCYVALHFARNRPAVSGLGMVLASIKPNFIIPLILLMFFRRDFKALTLGILFCAVAAATGIGWLSYHNGLQQVITDVRSGQEALHVDPTEMPINTWTRVDLLGMYAKLTDWVPGDKIYLLGMLLFIPVIGIFLWQLRDKELNTGASGLSAFIVCLAMLLGLYHHTYDCMLLIVPAISVLFYGATTLKEIPAWARILVAALVAVPAINYVSSKSVMEAFSLEPLSFSWQAVTLINGVSMLLALLILLFFAARTISTGKSVSTGPVTP